MKITIGNKLKIAFTIVIISMLVISGISYIFLQRSNDALRAIDEDTARIDLYNDVAFQMVRANAAIRGYMIYKKQDMLDNHYEIREKLRESVEALQAKGETDEGFTTFVTNLDAWEAAIEKDVLAVLQRGDDTLAEQNALPILGKGSQELVVFSKEMAATNTAAIHTKIQDLHKNSATQLRTIVVISLIIIVISMVIATITGRNIGRRMQRTIDTLNVFSTGDLTQRLEMGSRDEFASLARSFNEMAEKLSAMMRTVNQASHTVASTSAELTASSEEVSNAAMNVAESVQDISTSLENQEHRTHQMREVSTEVLAKMDGISHSVDVTDDAMNTAKAMADEGYSSVTAVTDQMDIIAAHTLTLNERMEDLADNTNSIELAAKVIKDIADQTNLLALNASIEAARAGEAGKGFAVVAEEVRKLADESNKAAGEIEQVITSIMTNTRQIEQDITNSHYSVTVGKTKVDVASDLFTRIVASFDDVQEQTATVTSEIHGIHEGLAQIAEQIAAIDASAERSLTRAQNVASAAEEQTASVEEIAASTAHLSERAHELADATKAFTY